MERNRALVLRNAARVEWAETSSWPRTEGDVARRREDEVKSSEKKAVTGRVILPGGGEDEVNSRVVFLGRERTMVCVCVKRMN